MMKTGKILVVGSSNTDMTVKTDHLPLPGETVLGGQFVMGQGGKGANQAIAATRMGGDVAFFCKVGNDVFGNNAIRYYKTEGIDISGIKYSEMPTGVALISVDASGENCIVVASGANGDFSSEDVRYLSEKIANAGILLLQLEIPVEVVAEIARIAYNSGVYVVLNPAPAVELPESVFRHVSLIVPNQTEAAFYTGIDVKDEKSALAAAEKFKQMGVPDVIITMGSSGSMLYGNGVMEFVKAERVMAVDTTAAGDTYCGALCVALSEGKSLVEAAEFATSAAALAVQRPGAQESIPFRDEIEK